MKKLVAFFMAFALCFLCFGTYGFEDIACTDEDHANAHTVQAASLDDLLDDDLLDDDNSLDKKYLFLRKDSSSYSYSSSAKTLTLTLSFDSESAEKATEATIIVSAPLNILGRPAVGNGIVCGSLATSCATVSTTSGAGSVSTVTFRVSASAGESISQSGYVTIVYPVDTDYLSWDWYRERTISISGSVKTASGETIGFDSYSSSYTVYICDHATTDVRVVKEATCEASGTKETYCVSCGCSIKKETVLPTSHDLDYSKPFNEMLEPYIAPTCKSTGRGCFKCRDCGKLITATVPKLDHTFGERKLVNGIYYYECLVCATTEVAQNQCSHPTGNYELLSVIKESTCSEHGSARYRCPVCKQIEERELPLADHSLSAGVVTTSPTCTATGIKTSSCVVCKKTVVETVLALGHAYGEWTTVLQATCVTNGREARTCTVCKNVEYQDVIGAGHKYGSWVTTTEATCTAEGVSTRTCSLCSNKETLPISMKAHTYGDWETTTAPTCSAAGTATRVCAVCSGKDTKVLAIVSDAHIYGDWSVVSSKTCVTDGEKTHTCTLCGHVENDVDPCSGHVMGAAEVKGKVSTKTCGVCGYKEATKTVKNGVEKTLTSVIGSLAVTGSDADKNLVFEIQAMDMAKQASYQTYLSFYKAYTYKVLADGVEVPLNSSMTMSLELDAALDDYDVSIVVLRGNAFYPVNNIDRNGHAVEINGADLLGAEAIFVVKGEESAPNLLVPIIVTVVTLVIAGAAIAFFMVKGKKKETF